MQSRQGFTLIELMIVVAIVAILAAVALPAYQNYTVRARVAEGLALASAAKVKVVENAANGNDFDSDWNPPIGSRNVSSVTVDGASGIITVTMATRGGGGTLVFEPSPTLVAGTPPASNIRWSCSGGTMQPSQRPPECR